MPCFKPLKHLREDKFYIFTTFTASKKFVVVVVVRKCWSLCFKVHYCRASFLVYY